MAFPGEVLDGYVILRLFTDGTGEGLGEATVIREHGVTTTDCTVVHLTGPSESRAEPGVRIPKR